MSDAETFLNRATSDPDDEPGDWCYLCENEPAEEEHHILPQRFNGSDAETNTVDLCHDCHWKLERLYNKDFYNALGIDDPRQTQETHIVCYTHNCTNQATGMGAHGYYCEDHRND